MTVFFTLMIFTAGFGRFGLPPISAGFWAAIQDANTVSASPITADSNSGKPTPSTDSNTSEPRVFSADISALAIDALCTDILTGYVSADGRIDFKTLRRKRLELINVLAEFAALDPNTYASWPQREKLAFWINAHNMYILKAIIDNYPIQPSRFKMLFYPSNSIMMIPDFWSKPDCRIMGENYTLEEIENKILHGQFDDPRICLAVYYGTSGCAPLRREPYYGRDLDKQFDDQARIFVESGKGMRIDRDNSVVYLSPIFQWYGNEFVIKYTPDKQFADRPLVDAAVLTYLIKQIPAKDADWLLRKIFTVKYMKYDWALNEQP